MSLKNCGGLVLAYIVLTYLLYLVGPINWDHENLLAVSLILFLAWVSFLVGNYLSTLTVRNLRSSRVENRWNLENVDFSKLMVLAGLSSLVVVPMTVASMTGKSAFDINTYLSNQGANFIDFQNFNATGGGGGVLTLLARSLLSWPIFVFFALLPKYWSGLGKKKKALSVLIILFYAGISFARGTDKQIADIAIFVSAGFFFFNVSKKHSKNIGQTRGVRIRRFRTIIIALIAAAVLLTVFADRRIERYGGEMPECFTYLKICFKDESVWRSAPDPLKALAGFGATYLSQGYEGLGKSFNYDWYPVFPLGQSPMLLSISDNYLGTDLYRETYNYRMRREWDDRILWATMFTWIANSVSYAGVPFVMFVFGVLFGVAYQMLARTGNDVYIVVLSFLALMIVYSPANYQLGMSLDMYVAWLLSLIYFFFRRFPRFIRQR